MAIPQLSKLKPGVRFPLSAHLNKIPRLMWGILFIKKNKYGIERERGRENGSFPVAETCLPARQVLKPLGFKNFLYIRNLFASPYPLLLSKKTPHGAVFFLLPNSHKSPRTNLKHNLFIQFYNFF